MSKPEPKIYISGPITGTDDYMERFAAAERHLRELGYGIKILNPAKENAVMASMGASYYSIMHQCLREMQGCNMIYMIKGWQGSKGARLEYAYADAMGFEICYEDPADGEKEQQT
ncbi:MAG: DUF4406 domain-containing protein [Clostridia bacterium]|nr:DUF4406 domain-containing protein [Clostridia bacterium]